MEDLCNADWYQAIALGAKARQPRTSAQRKGSCPLTLGAGREKSCWQHCWLWHTSVVRMNGGTCDIHLQLARARAAGWTHCWEVSGLNPTQFCWTGRHWDTLGRANTMCHPQQALDPLQTSCLTDHWHAATSAVASGCRPTIPNKHI